MKGVRMIQLPISPEDKEVVIEALESYLADLRMEISDTDLREFKMNLKKKRDILERAVLALHESSHEYMTSYH